MGKIQGILEEDPFIGFGLFKPLGVKCHHRLGRGLAYHPCWMYWSLEDSALQSCIWSFFSSFALNKIGKCFLAKLAYSLGRVDWDIK